MGLDAYDNITTEETTQLSQNGWTATSTTIFDGVDMSDPSSTLQNAILDVAVQRCDPHPSGQDMQADVISAKALSSNQITVTVNWRKLSPIDGPPDDSLPGLMTIGSSVQQSQTAQDKDGNLLLTPYLTENNDSSGNFIVQNTLTTTGDPTVLKPTNTATADVQIPNTVIRFQRREQNIPTEKIQQYVATVNNSAINWNGFAAAARTLLCTRIESNTNDNGVTYIVEYEFQYNEDTWDFFAFYVIPNNNIANGTNISIYIGQVYGAGDTPPDAAPTIFEIYDQEEFGALLLA